MSDVKVYEDGGFRQVLVDGQMHSIDDEPAVVYADGTRFWYRHGKIHRDDAPAVIYPNGVEEWFSYGVRHRAGDPALIYGDGEGVDAEYRGVKQWWTNGKMVREDLPQRVILYRKDLAALRKRHFGG